MANISDDMYEFDRAWSDTEEYPYGFVDNDVGIFEHGSDGSSTYDYWVAVHDEEWGMHPGYDRWDTRWENEFGVAKHDWDWQGDLGGRELGQTYPNDAQGGYSTSFSISVSTSGGTGTVGWSDQVDCVEVDDRPYPDDYARWDVYMNCDSSQENWTDILPGSEIRTYEFDGWEEVLHSHSGGQFEKNWSTATAVVADNLYFKY